MHSRLLLSALAACGPSVVLTAPHPSTLKPRDSRADHESRDNYRAEAVKEAFRFAWDGYYKYAFPHDELHPISNGYSDSRNGWGASAVDAFSTAIVMEDRRIVNQILRHINEVDFGQTSDQISLFETTIRYIGGMLSGYDLLKGPMAGLADDAGAVDGVLRQAQNLADNLSFAFDTPTGIPSNNLYYDPPRTDGSTTNGLATIGSLVLEWTHLSDLTGNATYAALSQKGESYLLSPQPASSEPWPGLVGTNVDITTGLFQDASGGWTGGDDSFYEYLIKMYVYDPTRFAEYRDRWILAADSSIEHLASHPSTRPDLTFLAYFEGQERIFISQHLACFDGGNFILAGLVLDAQKYVDFGLSLVNACHDTYNSTLTGIGPEQFSWVESGDASTDGADPSPPADQQAFYERAGFYITNGNYILRPEVIESFYYAYRATGDQLYRDWAWEAFVAINGTARAGSGFAELVDVNAADGGGYMDFQDSFLFAEVLKYSYLIHAPDAIYQFNHEGKNEYVFNTEAHPFKVAGPAI